MALNYYPPSLRAWGAIGVLTVWVGSLAWLGVRQLGQTESSTIASQASLRLGPGAAWFTVAAGDVQVGSAGITLDTLSPGYRISQTVTLEIPDDTGLVRATRRTDTRLAGTLEFRSVNSQYSVRGRHAEWNMIQRGDTTVSSYSATGEPSVSGNSVFPGPIAPTSVFPYRLALSGALALGSSRKLILTSGWPPSGLARVVSVGKPRNIRFADSSALDASTGHMMAVRYDSVRAYPVAFDGPSGPQRLWIDHQGTIAGMETVFGVHWERNDFEVAVPEFRRQLQANEKRIQAALPILTPLVTARSADTSTGERRYRVEHRDGRPIDQELLALLAGGRQVIRGDTIVVTTQPVAIDGKGFEDSPYDPMIQEEGYPLKSLGASLRSEGATRANLESIATLLRQRIRIDTAASAPLDAMGALLSGRAQPDGLVRLYVAVLRASGVPARLVIGVSPARDHLRTHAWAEVREAHGTGWQAVDPLLGQFPARTSLIRLAFGGSSNQQEMLALLADVTFIDLGPAESHQ